MALPLNPGDPSALLVYTAAGVTAAGVIWRAIIRPLRRASRSLGDLIEQWKQVLESTRDLTAIVAKNIVSTDERLRLLEASVSIRVETDEERQYRTRLAQQIQQAWEAQRIAAGWDGSERRHPAEPPRPA